MRYTLLKNRVTGERRVKNNDTGVYVSENENPALYLELRKKAINNRKRAEVYQVYKDLGLNSYKNLSGVTCWE